MAKKTSVKELSDNDLVEKLSESKEELFNLRFQNATGQLENFSRITVTKREVARLRTELRAREIASAEALEAHDSQEAS